jgi:hypothetical protein
MLELNIDFSKSSAFALKAAKANLLPEEVKSVGGLPEPLCT